MSIRGNKAPRWLSWTGLVYYGEIFGFVFAWIVGGVALVASSQAGPAGESTSDQIAAAEVLPANDLPGTDDRALSTPVN